MAGWIEGFLWRAEGEPDDDGGGVSPQGKEDADGDEEVKISAGDDVVEDEGKTVDEIVEKTGDLEV